MVTFIVMGLAAVFILASIYYSILILVLAFKKSVLWGMGSLLVPFVVFIYIGLNTDVALKPFIKSIVAMIIGGVLAGVGIALEAKNIAPPSESTAIEQSAKP